MIKIVTTLKLQTYFIGVFWFILSLLSSVLNDIISKYTGMRLHSFEISFFRFLFSALTLLPLIFYYGKDILKTNNLNIHILRGILLFIGISAWTYGLTVAQVSVATIISFSIPVFVLILAVFFLNEKILWQRWLATIIGFLGIIVTLKPNSTDFNPYTLVFIFAALSFAALDVINKRFIVQETVISMLFYSALSTALLAVPFAFYYWQTPSLYELVMLFILGISANLILFLLLRAFVLVDATAVAPYRYLELLFSSTAAYLVFGELPEKSTIYGGLILIPSVLFIAYSESKLINKKLNDHQKKLCG